MYTTTLGYKYTILTLSLSPITQSGLLAGVAAQLLALFKDDSKFKYPESAAREAILTLTYISLIASIFATVASVTLTTACAWRLFNRPMDSLGPRYSLLIGSLLMDSLDVTTFESCKAISFEF
jgi:hypothetical protein